jgi:hypothetical protein
MIAKIVGLFIAGVVSALAWGAGVASADCHEQCYGAEKGGRICETWCDPPSTPPPPQQEGS